MGMAEFYAPHRTVNSITDAGGRLLGWTDANGNALRRTGGRVTPAGGVGNTFEYADPALADPRVAKPQRPRPDAAAARAADIVQPAAPAETRATPRKLSASERRRVADSVRASMMRHDGYRNPRLAREMVARRPQDYVRDGWAREHLLELLRAKPELEAKRWAKELRANLEPQRSPPEPMVGSGEDVR